VNVVDLRVTDWDKDGTIVKVSHVKFDDGSEAPGYDLPPGVEVGKPLPDGWEVAQSKSGKPYIKVPKAGKGGFGGGAAAFRNTKEGQFYEQERMDRRTALMQAIATGVGEEHWHIYADRMYEWLRATSTGADTRVSSQSVPAPVGHTSTAQNKKTWGGSSRDEGQPSKTGKASGGTASGPSASGDSLLGEDPGSTPTSCTHTNTSPLLPTGRAVKEGFAFCIDCRTVVRA
jgi:hypothetical protein